MTEIELRNQVRKKAIDKLRSAITELQQNCADSENKAKKYVKQSLLLLDEVVLTNKNENLED